MEELVDILVTTYNTNEKYLRKQIESILRQTYNNYKSLETKEVVIRQNDNCVIKIPVKEYLKGGE